MSYAEDVIAIEQLVARCCDAVARRAWDEVADLYVDDGLWAPPGMEARGRTAIRDALEQVVGPHPLLVQIASNPMIAVTGDSATARWQIQEVGRDAKDQTITVLGTYDDTLTRTADGWRFTERRFDLLLFATHPSEGMVRPFAQ
jgi:uncharacterized protein (TIGR02246 family)